MCSKRAGLIRLFSGSPSESCPLGFKAKKGNYDFVFDWGKEKVDINELIFFADKVHAALKSCKVFFNIETI